MGAWQKLSKEIWGVEHFDVLWLVLNKFSMKDRAWGVIVGTSVENPKVMG